MQKSIISAFMAFVSAKILPETSDIVRDCSDFDSKSVQLVTFDVFAALMDLESSLLRNVA